MFNTNKEPSPPPSSSYHHHNYYESDSSSRSIISDYNYDNNNNNNRDVVLCGVNTNRNDNHNLKQIIQYNYERFYYQAQSSQEQIMIVEQIVLAVLSNSGRFIKLIRNNNNSANNYNDGSSKNGGSRCVRPHRNSIEKEVYIVDFNTARDRIIQIFHNTKPSVSSF